jgi:very-short-patch-repair endonuclease
MNILWFIEYNRGNKERSDKLRKNMTLAEQKIRFDILSNRPRWCKFIRQKRIKWFILDFYCSKLLLCIEIDWSSHDNKQEYDQKRTEILQQQWIITIRYTNQQVLNNNWEVFDDLIDRITERSRQLNSLSW